MRHLLLAGLLAGTAAVAQPPPPRPDTLTGTFVLPDGVTLPPRARLTIALSDMSALYNLGEASIAVAGRSGEVRFALGYDADEVTRRSRYALTAEVRDADDRLIYDSLPEYVRVRFDRRGLPSAPARLTLARSTHVDRVSRAEAAPPGPRRADKIQASASGAGPAPPAGAVGASPPDTVTPSLAGGTLMNETWRLTELSSAGASARRVEPSERYTLTFRGSGVYSGEAGCARFFGQYEATQSGDITLSPADVTRTGCPAGSASADPVLDVLAGIQRYGSNRAQLALGGTAGLLAFRTDARPGSGMVVPQVDRLSAYVCGDAGTFLLRTGRGDAEVWLSGALAARTGAGAPLGIYHILGQVPAPGLARYAYGPLAAVVDAEGVQGGSAMLEIGAERLRCTAPPEPAVDDTTARPVLRAEGRNWTVQIYGTPPEPVYVEVFDGVTLTGGDATVTTPAPGITEYRSSYGLVVTVTAGACADGSDRARLVRPEGTSEGCRTVID